MTPKKKPKAKPAQRLPRGIRKRGKSWYAFLTYKDGSNALRSIGKTNICTLEYAKQQRVIWQREIREDRYERKMPRPESYNVREVFDAYLDDLKIHGKDVERWTIAWKLLEPHFGSKDVRDLTTEHVRKYIAVRQEAGRKNSTINRELTGLKAALTYATGVTPPMVTKDKLPKFPKSFDEKPFVRKNFIGESDYLVLARNAKPIWLRALLAVAYTFGLRRGELVSLKVSQCDFIDKWIQLWETKSGEARKVQMTEEVFQLLRACARGKKPEDCILSEDGKPIRNYNMRREWEQLCIASGLGKHERVHSERDPKSTFPSYTGLRLHDLRRSAVRNLVRAGVSESTAMKISGHETRSIFDRYNIGDEADLSRATELLEKRNAGRAKAGTSQLKRLKTRTKTGTVPNRVN